MDGTRLYIFLLLLTLAGVVRPYALYELVLLSSPKPGFKTPIHFFFVVRFDSSRPAFQPACVTFPCHYCTLFLAHPPPYLCYFLFQAPVLPQWSPRYFFYFTPAADVS